MPIKINRIPSLAFFSAGTLLGLILTCLVFAPETSSRLEMAQKDYGETLATLTAKRVIDAYFNNDLVRLQVVLQNLVTHPQVVQATIHDVENNLLVQAGEVRPEPERHSAYTASIVLHDSISGYVTLTIQNMEYEYSLATQILWFIGIVTLLLLAYALFKARSFEWIPTTKQVPSAGADEEPCAQTDSTDQSLSAAETKMVYAVIYIKNHEVLTQQLTNDTFRSTFNNLENIIRDVLTLYNGQEYSAENKSYILKFPANDARNEAIFRASCSAFLIVELASIINKIPLDLAAFVSANKEDLVPAKLPVAGLVLESQAAQDELIQQRLNFMEVGTDDGRSIVANFEQPYCQLLENQRKYLAQVLT